MTNVDDKDVYMYIYFFFKWLFKLHIALGAPMKIHMSLYLNRYF